MQTALCVLLLACGALAAPSETARSYAKDDTKLNSALDTTRSLLAKVTDFMNRITEMTNSGKLSGTEAMTILPDFVVEAVKLRDELEAIPFKIEDPEAVKRVQNVITSSLHSFAQKYDDQITAQSNPTTSTTTQEPEPAMVITEQPEAVEEVSTDEAIPETTTLLAPVQTDAEEEAVYVEADFENEVVEVEPFRQPLPVFRRPFVPQGNPFSNTHAFRFTNPALDRVEGSDPFVTHLPSGGYYVYYKG